MGVFNKTIIPLVCKKFLIKHRALTIFGRYKQYTIDLMVCLIGNEADMVYMFLIGNEAA